MPRYHYNVYDGVDILDHDGVDFRDIDQARVEALRYAAGIIHDEALKKRLGNEWRLEVTDAEGVILLRIDLLTTTPATKGEEATAAFGASVMII